MVNQEILKSVRGEGPILNGFVLEPSDHLQWRPNVIFDFVNETKVIHLGCTDHIDFIESKIEQGLFLHTMLTNVASKCIGLDINNKAIEHLKSLGIDNVFCSDITKPGSKEITADKWDYLVMGEMLEHINNPVSFLEAIRDNYSDHIKNVIITVPNAFSTENLKNLLVSGCEAINVDHRYWFTPFTLAKVVYEAGLTIDDMVMCSYENMRPVSKVDLKDLKEKPILRNTIMVACHWSNI